MRPSLHLLAAAAVLFTGLALPAVCLAHDDPSQLDTAPRASERPVQPFAVRWQPRASHVAGSAHHGAAHHGCDHGVDVDAANPPASLADVAAAARVAHQAYKALCADAGTNLGWRNGPVIHFELSSLLALAD